MSGDSGTQAEAGKRNGGIGEGIGGEQPDAAGELGTATGKKKSDGAAEVVADQSHATGADLIEKLGNCAGLGARLTR